MSVYVDAAVYGFGRMIMCHMIQVKVEVKVKVKVEVEVEVEVGGSRARPADTPDELHAMADRIGIARRWFQVPPKASFWHYDIAKTKRALAVEAGAIECDRNSFVGHLRRIRSSEVFGPDVTKGRT